MNEIDFYCLKRNAYVIMPISECYKMHTTKKTRCNYTVNAVDPNGLRLTKQITKEVYDRLQCRTIDNH